MPAYKRKEIIGDSVLYLGDCLEILPTLGKVDVCITDPPYEFDASGAGLFRTNRKCMDKVQEKGLDRGFDISVLNILIGNGCNSIAIFFHWEQNYKIISFFHESPLNKSALCIWKKTNPMPVANKHYQPELEYWLHAWRKPFGVGGDNLLEKKRVYQSSCGQCDIDHPTVKPIGLMGKIVKNASEKDSTVLDPYAGSGSTGVACAKLGRKFIGIELDETYFEIACERIQKAYDQPDLFVEPPKPQVQEDMEI
ncbi:MAG: site-specific DNA-methyltransferase [Colwellia sp.]|nr:site-specific DNA-methyltransferase [Colwellia sp.]